MRQMRPMSRPLETSGRLHPNSTPRVREVRLGAWHLLDSAAISLLRDLLGEGDLVGIKRHRHNADQLFRAVENLSQLCTGRFECVFLRTVNTGGGAAHDICSLLYPVDAIEARVYPRMRQCLSLAPRRSPADVLELQLDGIAVVTFEVPRFLDVRLPRGIGMDVSVYRRAGEREGTIGPWNVTRRRCETADDHRHSRLRTLFLRRDREPGYTKSLSRAAVRILNCEEVDEHDGQIGILRRTGIARTGL